MRNISILLLIAPFFIATGASIFLDGTLANYFRYLMQGEYIPETLLFVGVFISILFAIYNKDFRRDLVDWISNLFYSLSIRSESSSYGSSNYEDLRLAIVKIESRLDSPNSAAIELSGDERQTILEGVEAGIISELTESLDATLNRIAFEGEIAELQRNSLSRLSNQIVVLGSRANASLWLGITFSVAGLIVLYFTFFYSLSFSDDDSSLPTNMSNWLDLLREYLPRLSLVLIIETVGFFFLRLYSRALVELRYAQNETTNVESRFISLLTARVTENQELLKITVEKLASIDRNGVIDRTQTTIDIERERVTAEMDSRLVEALTGLVRGKAANS